MKKCLWQFHSRAWDRKRQNECILTKTRQILCGDPVEHATPEDRCYWVDAVCMADAFRKRCPWLGDMDRAGIEAHAMPPMAPAIFISAPPPPQGTGTRGPSTRTVSRFPSNAMALPEATSGST